MHFISNIHNTTTSLCPPQTPPASRKRKGDEEEEEDNLITIEKPYYDELIKMASVALFEACYGRTRSETEEWVENMNKKIADAATGKPPPSPPTPPKKTKRIPPSLTEEQLRRIQKVDINYIAGLKCSLDSVQNQMTRIATQVASLTTSQNEILTDIQQMKEDITAALEQEGKGSSFGYRDEDGYKRCRSEICCDTEMKMYTIHTCYLDCVKEMMREYHWWDSNYWFKCHMDTFLQLALDGSIGSDEWLNCYKEIVNNMERDWEACARHKVAIPHKIHHLAKQLSLDALFTTDEEREAGHTMVSCDLTDCHYCDEKKKKTATLS